MSRRRDQALDRDQQILDRLAKIEHKVDSIEETNAFALRAEAEKHFAEVKKIFGNSLRRAQVYLAANGVRSVQEIAKHLRMQRQNVGPDLKHLAEEGLLELVDSHSNRDIWAKKPIDRTLRITLFLCKEFDLQKNGLRQKSGRKPARRNKN
ncbi:MAG: helix-turn-helix domain-containing protein [Candidatus Methylomirabilota bacterium]|jgi:Fic family protein